MKASCLFGGCGKKERGHTPLKCRRCILALTFFLEKPARHLHSVRLGLQLAGLGWDGMGWDGACGVQGSVPLSFRMGNAATNGTLCFLSAQGSAVACIQLKLLIVRAG